LENREDQQPDPLKPAVPPPSPADNGASTGPHVPAPAAADEAAPLTVGQWLLANGFSLLFIAAILGLIFYNFDLEGQWSIVKVALGLSFVIFIHELGHFLVAKWCDVHVTTFSIGFGPALPGCSYQWGETTYKLSLIPLGGYVQMVGQVDGDEAGDGSDDDPRSYRNKSVGQRMAIISAGVIMNVILAVVCFIVVYQGPGKDRDAAVIGSVDTDSPAFRQGIRSGDDVVQIGDVKNPTFETLMITVMASQDKEKIDFIVKQPDGHETQLYIEPRKRSRDTRPMIGVTPAYKLLLAPRRYVDNSLSIPAFPGSAAIAALPAFGFGDRIVATTDPAAPGQLEHYDPTRITELPDDPRAPGLGQKDYFAFARRMQDLADKEVIVRVERGSEKQVERIDIRVPPIYRHGLGARMRMGEVISIRNNSPASDKVHGPNPDTKRHGDLIQAVTVTQADGKSITYRDKPKENEQPLDPERLPHQLKEWSAALAESAQLHPETAKKLSWEVALELRRHRDAAGPQFDIVQEKLQWDNGWRYDKAVPVTQSSPLAIPELGLAYQVETTVAAVDDPQSPLKAGDVIKNIRYDMQGPKEEVKVPWRDELEEGQWAEIAQDVLQVPYAVTKVYLKVSRDKKIEEVEITPSADKTWALADRGWILSKDTRRQKASNIFEAVAMGLKDTQNNMTQVFQNVRGMLTGRLSAKNLVGPLMIARVAYKFASLDTWELIFFLGLISVNLAVVNFLPMPVLDGGHMVFLIYEKLRGKPASEGVRIAATYAGLALILSLFVFVIWLDITRLLG
jgi:regulator of sigma E protease